MQLHHLHAFLAVAQDLSFRRAAARLFLSQPALSAQIGELERHLGVRLFDRDRTGTRLTLDGAELVPLARRAVAAVADVELAKRTSPRHRRRFGVGLLLGGIAAATWPLLRTFSDARPDLRLEVQYLGFGEALPALSSGTADVVLAIGPFGEEDGAVTTVGRIPVGVILPSGHPRAADPGLDLAWAGEHIGDRPPAGMGRTFAKFWTLQDAGGLPLGRLRMLDHGAGVSSFVGIVAAGGIAAWPAVVPAAPPAVVLPLLQPRTAPLQLLAPHHRHPDVRQFCRIATRLAQAA